MKHSKQIILIFLIMLSGCIPEPDKKFFIKSVKVNEGVRIDWYVYSSISSFAPDYLQLSTKAKEPFFISFYVTDINFENDTLFISQWKNGFEKLDKTKVKSIKIFIDTSGKQWNDATSRIARLKEIGVTLSEPHFIDVSCPDGECY